MNGTYALVHRDVRTTKGGKPYLVVGFQGIAQFKVWENYPAYIEVSNARIGGFFAVTGTFKHTSFGYEVQSDLAIEEAEPPPPDPRITDAAVLIGEMVEDIKDPLLSEFASAFLSENLDVMMDCGAARSVHHSERGGLVIHVSRVMLNARKLSGNYPGCNADLAVVGALVHDCGKILENRYNAGEEVMPFSVQAELMGHIVLGAMYVADLFNRVAGAWLDDDGDDGRGGVRATATLHHLLHLVCSHHGTLEWGSPVTPRTLEAVVLHAADLLDARAGTMEAAMKVEPIGGSEAESFVYNNRGGNYVSGLVPWKEWNQ